MPTHDDFPGDYLDGPRRDRRTGVPFEEAGPPRSDEDRRLHRVRDRERWISAISVPPPAP